MTGPVPPGQRVAGAPVASPAAPAEALRGRGVAVLIPCFNEEITVGKVIDDFRRELPEAQVVVFDNRSTDRTAEIARARGARVIPVPVQGKGHVVARMFEDRTADWYVMVDGDDTYSAEHVTELLEPLLQGRADLVVGTRLQVYAEKSFRPLHVAGNNLVRGLVNWMFRAKLTDILSGYRAYGRRVLAALPIVSAGFEVETELTVNALYFNHAIVEVPIPYKERPPGSHSKLRTFSDGFRVLWRMFSMFRTYKPLTFFGLLGIVLSALAIWAGAGPVADYLEHGYVYKVPRAVLATGLILLGTGCGFLGLLLHAINWRLKELHNLLTRPR